MEAKITVQQYARMAKDSPKMTYWEFENKYRDILGTDVLPFVWDFWVRHPFPKIPAEYKTYSYTLSTRTKNHLFTWSILGFYVLEMWENLMSKKEKDEVKKYSRINSIRQKYKLDVEEEILQRKLLLKLGFVDEKNLINTFTMQIYYERYPEERPRYYRKRKDPEDTYYGKIASVAAEYKRWENESGDNYHVSLIEKTPSGKKYESVTRDFKMFPNYHDLADMTGEDRGFDFINADGSKYTDNIIYVRICKKMEMGDEPSSDLGPRYFVIERKCENAPTFEELIR